MKKRTWIAKGWSEAIHFERTIVAPDIQSAMQVIKDNPAFPGAFVYSIVTKKPAAAEVAS